MLTGHSAPFLRYLFQVLGLAALYFTFGYMSFLTTVAHYIVTPVFFVAEGIALATIIVLGARVWPGIFLGQLALALSTGLEPLPSSVIAGINSLEALIGFTLFKYWKINPLFHKVRDLTRLFVMIFFILQPFSATLGTLTLMFFDAIRESQHYLQAWTYWWFGNCLGQFLITPFILIAFSLSDRLEIIKRSVQASIIPITLILPATWLIFNNTISSTTTQALVVYAPLLIWIAIRSGTIIVSFICSGITFLSLYQTAQGLGPFVVDGTPNIFDMNIFVLGISLTALFVSALFTERKLIEAELRNNEMRLYAIIESSSIPKAINDEQGRIIYLNKAFIQTFGYTLDDIPTLTEWWPKAYPDKQYRRWVRNVWSRNLKKALHEHTDFEPIDLTVQCQNGSQRNVIATAAPLNSPGFNHHHLVTLVDITVRKQLENQLFQSHKFLEDLSNNIPGFIFQFQLFPDGRSCLPFASKGITEVMGIAPEMLVHDASPLLNLTHPDDADKLHASIAESASSLNEWRHEFRIITPKKEIKWIQGQSKPNRQSDDSIIWNGHATDITESKNTSLKFEIMLDLASDGIHILDEDGFVVQFSRSFANMLGYSYEEAAHLNVLDWDALIPQKDLINVAREIINTPRVFETRHKRKDGSIFDVEINARGIEISGKKFIYASSRDITNRKLHEQEMEYQRMRLANIIEGTHIGTWEWNVQSGAVIFNERWAEMIGYSLAELPPTTIETWIRFAHPEDLKQSDVLLKEHFAGNIPYYEYEARMRHRDGHWIWMLDRGKVLSWTNDGKPLMMFGTHQDITERKEREVMLIEARQQAETANTAKTRFLAMMSHEIRTPMNAVLGMAYLLSKTTLDARQSTYLRNIEGSSNILLGVINDILDYSKIEANKIELDSVAFDLNSNLENIAAIAAIAAKDKAIDVLFHVEPNVPRYLVGDPVRLSQILVNLINNAIKFTDQGEVIIRFEIIETGEPHTVFLAVSVRDSGIGMSADQMKNLFQAFSQADSSITRRFGGTGLGLSISHRLAQHMQGNIAVQSELGKGSTFRCVVKLNQGESNQKTWVQIPSPLQFLHVMIVDNHVTTRQIMVEIVQSLGWKATTVDNEHQAIDKLSDANAARTDLLVLMTRTQSEQDLETLQFLDSAIPSHLSPRILLITNNMDPIFAKRVSNRPATAILIRPFTPLNLLDTVSSLYTENDDTNTHPDHLHESAKKQFAGTRILIAEDNEFNQLLISELLSHWGITVSMVQNGAECLERLKTSQQPFDLILMDIQMPVMNGLEATQHIRREMKMTDIPIIALTANVMEQDQKKFQKVGMDSFLPKPFDPEQIYHIMQQFIKGR